MEFLQVAEAAKAQNEHFRKIYPELREPKHLLLAQAVKLSEEAGELAEQILKLQGFQRAEKVGGSVAEEIADVVFVAFLIADDLGIDVGNALAEKIRQVAQRRGTE